MQLETTDPALKALTDMREMQDYVFETDERLPDYETGLGRLKALELVALMTTPTTALGALEILKFAAVEIQCRDFDRGLVAEAIMRAAAVLEREHKDL